jgi:hypothetical protein
MKLKITTNDYVTYDLWEVDNAGRFIRLVEYFDSHAEANQCKQIMEKIREAIEAITL